MDRTQSCTKFVIVDLGGDGTMLVPQLLHHGVVARSMLLPLMDEPRLATRVELAGVAPDLPRP